MLMLVRVGCPVIEALAERIGEIDWPIRIVVSAEKGASPCICFEDSEGLLFSCANAKTYCCTRPDLFRLYELAPSIVVSSLCVDESPPPTIASFMTDY